MTLVEETSGCTAISCNSSNAIDHEQFIYNNARTCLFTALNLRKMLLGITYCVYCEAK